MPINGVLDLQRKDVPLGEIRTGTSVAVPGKTWRKPVRLGKFRFTTDEVTALAVAEKYDGEPRPWDRRPGRWEVVTALTALKVWIPPRGLAVDANMEMWNAGRLQRKCDGTAMSWPHPTPGEPRRPCMCPQPDDSSDPDSILAARDRRMALAAEVPPQACKPHTLIHVTLADLPGLNGVWRIATGSENTAMESADQGDIMALARGQGCYLPATVLIHTRFRISDGSPYPVLAFRIDMSMEDLARGELPPGPGGLITQLRAGGQPGRAAITAAPAPRELPGPAPQAAPAGDDEVVEAELLDDDEPPAPEVATPSGKPKQEWTAQDIADAAGRAASPQEVQDLISLARANRVHQDNVLTDPGPPEVWEDLTPYLLHLRRDLAGRRAAA